MTVLDQFSAKFILSSVIQHFANHCQKLHCQFSARTQPQNPPSVCVWRFCSDRPPILTHRSHHPNNQINPVRPVNVIPHSASSSSNYASSTHSLRSSSKFRLENPQIKQQFPVKITLTHSTVAILVNVCGLKCRRRHPK